MSLTSKPYFGEIVYGPSDGVLKQIDDVKTKIAKTRDLTATYNKKYKDLAEFNKTVSEGYINNLNVIVDISRLLNAYKDLMEQVIETLKKFDESITVDLQGVNLDHIKNLTVDSLRNVDSFLKTQTGSIKKLFETFGRKEEVTRLDKTLKNFDETITQASYFKGGFKVKKLKVVRIPKCRKTK